MPDLVVNIGPMPRQLALSQLEVPCSLMDELLFSMHVGQRVALAHQLATDTTIHQFATATLDRFTSREKTILAIFTDVTVLPVEAELWNVPQGSVFSVVRKTDDLVPPKKDTDHSGLDELSFPFVRLETYGQIGQQVSVNAHRICAFSGVEVKISEGAATPIRPVDAGGEIHTRNLIFLHDEPAHLFNRFAWTIGPDFEIIADAWAMGTDVLSTINPSGKLFVGDDRRHWPDETALAWHRQKFLERLG